MRAMPENHPTEVRDRADRIALGRLKNKLNPAQPRLDFLDAQGAFCRGAATLRRGLWG